VFAGIANMEDSIGFSTAEMYSIEEQTWATLDNMQAPINFVSCCHFRDLVYITGFNIGFIQSFSPKFLNFEILPIELETNVYKTLVNTLKVL
jgi:hypothetical protein